VPDIGYESIGGLGDQIEAIKDAVELPYLYADYYKEHKLTPPKGVLLYIDPAILRPGRLDLKVRVERPDMPAATEIFAKYLTVEVPIAAAELEQHAGDTAAAVRRLIETTAGAVYARSEETRFREVTKDLHRQRSEGRHGRLGQDRRQEGGADHFREDADERGAEPAAERGASRRYRAVSLARFARGGGPADAWCEPKTPTTA